MPGETTARSTIAFAGRASPPAAPVAEIVLAHRSERSVLDGPHALTPFFVNARPRMATCSGVAWFPGPYLAAVNLYGRHLRIYRVHSADGPSGEPRLELVHELADIGTSEDVAVAPNGRILAFTSASAGKALLSFHAIDTEMKPGPAYATLERPGPLHGLKFAPDSRHLAFTGIGSPGSVEVVRLDANPPQRVCHWENRYLPKRPKSIAFSWDGRFVAIVIAQNATPQPSEGLGGRLSVHRFDAATGLIDVEPVAELLGEGGPLENNEMCAVLPNETNGPYRILTANQGMDMIAAFDFDPAGNDLTYAGVFASGTPFPHGIDVSADGRFVAVANYGDDSIRVIEVPR